MKKNLFILGILSISLFLLHGTSIAADLIKDFVSFDQAYIPALALTSQGKIEESKKAMNLLKDNWKTFKETYKTHNKKDLEWGKDFDKVDQMISSADKIVLSGKDISRAHDVLEDVRIVFMKLRKRNNIDYYVDYLTEFHEPMEAVVLTAKDKTPETLTDGDVREIQTSLNQASTIWGKIENLKFDEKLFGFATDRTVKMKSYVQAESDALKRLKQTMGSKDKKLIIQVAVAIKPNFANLFMMFGDFERIK